MNKSERVEKLKKEEKGMQSERKQKNNAGLRKYREEKKCRMKGGGKRIQRGGESVQ